MNQGFRLDTDRVKLIALDMGLTERELLKRADVSKDIIARARRGSVTTATTIAKLAAVLECRPSELIVKGGD